MAGTLLGVALRVRVGDGDVLKLRLVECDRCRDRLFVEREHIRRCHPADTGEDNADADDEGKIDQAAETAAASGALLHLRLLRWLMAGRRLAVHGVCLLRLRASRPLRAVLDMRLLRMRARRVLLLYRARAGSARLSLLLLRTAAGGLRRTLRWALRAGWLSFVTKQLIKVLKMIGHGLISLSTWNTSLRPLGAGTPFPLGA